MTISDWHKQDEPEKEHVPFSTKRGTAAMDPETRKEVARKGGKSHSSKHMSEIGKKGGAAVARNKEHMAEIGRKGGAAGGKSRWGSLPERFLEMKKLRDEGLSLAAIGERMGISASGVCWALKRLKAKEESNGSN